MLDMLRMGLNPNRRPFALIPIALFQSAKGAFLLVVAALFWLAPSKLPHSEAFTQVLFIAAHGKDLPGVLVPVFGCYLIYVGIGLLRLRKSVRSALAISAVITIGLSLQRLGVFGESSLPLGFDRQPIYILILFDIVIYIYLAFHPDITRSFKR